MELKRTRDDSPDMDVFASHARHQWITNNVKDFKMPWDLRMNDSLDVVKRARNNMFNTYGVMPPLPQIEAGAAESSDGLGSSTSDASYGVRAIRNAHQRSWQDQLTYERKCAYRKWISIVAVNALAFEVARLQYLSGPLEYGKGGLAQSIRDCLGDKSSSTLHARAGPLLRYLKFWEDRGESCLPLTEPQVYFFVKSMETSAPSFPRSFLLSVSFATHLLGLMGGKQVLDSMRIAGAVKIHYGNRAKLRQRPPLTVTQVKVLERIVTDSRRNMADRVMSGYFLMLVYGRLRYSDGQRIVGMRLDLVHVDDKPVGFLECSADRTKTSVTLERKVRHLPIAVPVQCLTAPAWLPIWNRLREEQGLTCSGKFKENIPIMPAPLLGPRWTQAPLGVTTAGEWLRNLLKGTQTVGTVRIATHSCKCTLLAWAARYGLSHDTRKLLGYHTSSSDTSLLIYSRDGMSAPLRELVAMVDAVADGSFDPDLTRSGMFAREAERNLGDDSSSGEETSGCSEDEDDVEVFEEEKATEQIGGAWQPHVPGGTERQTIFRHVTSRCIHMVLDEAGNQLVCGRKLSDRYERQESKPRFMHPACGGCFRNL